jgi:hypothetical protein
MNRRTFVVRVQPDGPSTLENLSTQERVRVADLATVGPQIERWLEEPAKPASSGESLGRQDMQEPEEVSPAD